MIFSFFFLMSKSRGAFHVTSLFFDYLERMSLSVVEFSPYVSQLEKFHSFLRFEMKKKYQERDQG